MQIKKPLLIASAVAVVGVAGTAASVKALAESTSDNSSVVDKVAQRFNLNRDDVQKVFDEDRASHEAEREAKVEERLDKAVQDGKLTTDQKAKILAKIEELKNTRESEKDNLKDKTPEEMHTLMEQKRAELEQWAKDNNIPDEYLRFVGPGFRMHMRGKPDAGNQVHVHIDNGDEAPMDVTLPDEN